MTVTPFRVSSRGLLLIAVAFPLAACASVGAPKSIRQASNASLTLNEVRDSTRYEVSFVPSWNPATNPIEYPFSHAKQGFLTPTIGAAHGPGYAIFNPGSKPSPGLEKLSETGMPTPLDEEIMSAIEKGTAESIIRFSDGSAGPVHPTISTQFAISKNAPMVSLVGMIAPSPDWFYGASCVELCKDGNWLPNLTVPVFAWDSGGDAGTTYLAEDRDLDPKQSTRKARTAHFLRNGEPSPIGFFVFKRVPSDS